MKILIITLFAGIISVFQTYPDPFEVLKKVDKNMISDTKIIKGRMIIYGKRNTREIAFISYSKGEDKSFIEYLSPAKQKGTKMLKLENNLWIYSPSADRTIQLSGHMLKQSLMGSDISYEDMMEDNTLADSYNAKITSEEVLNGRKCWVIELNAKVKDVKYEKMKIWVDEEHYIVLKEELYAKSGQMLKLITFSEIKKVQNRWFATKMNFKDVLKNGKGTDFIIDNIQFDAPIEDYKFTKAVLKK